MKMTELWSYLSLVVDLSVRLPVINRLKCKTCNVADKDIRHDMMCNSVSDMQQQQQQKQLNLNAPCVCRRDPAVSSAAQTSPASLRAVRRTIIHGVPVRSPVQYAGAGAVCVYKSGRAGTAPGTALQCLTPTHPQLTLTCSSYKLCHPYTCKGFQNEFLCQVKKIAFHANSFSANNWRSKSYKQHRWLNSV